MDVLVSIRWELVELFWGKASCTAWVRGGGGKGGEKEEGREGERYVGGKYLCVDGRDYDRKIIRSVCCSHLLSNPV